MGQPIKMQWRREEDGNANLYLQYAGQIGWYKYTTWQGRPKEAPIGSPGFTTFQVLLKSGVEFLQGVPNV